MGDTYKEVYHDRFTYMGYTYLIGRRYIPIGRYSMIPKGYPMGRCIPPTYRYSMVP